MNATHKTIVTTFVMSFMICALALTLTLLVCQVSDATTKQNVTWDDYKSMIEVTQSQTGVMGIIIEDAPMTSNTSLINKIEKLLENKTFAVNIEDNYFDCSETSRSTALYLQEAGFNVKMANNLNFNTSSPYFGVGHCWAVVIDDKEGGVLAIETRLKSKSIGRIMTQEEAPLYYTAWLINPDEYNRIHPFEPPLPNPNQVICNAPATAGA
jgi:spore germination protein YaaH